MSIHDMSRTWTDIQDPPSIRLAGRADRRSLLRSGLGLATSVIGAAALGGMSAARVAADTPIVSQPTPILPVHKLTPAQFVAQFATWLSAAHPIGIATVYFVATESIGDPHGVAWPVVNYTAGSLDLSKDGSKLAGSGACWRITTSPFDSGGISPAQLTQVPGTELEIAVGTGDILFAKQAVSPVSFSETPILGGLGGVLYGTTLSGSLVTVMLNKSSYINGPH